MRAALAAGHVISDLGFIEYAATPEADGSFRKHACYRIGDKIIRVLTVSDTTWVSKKGRVGVASEVDYEREHAEMLAYPHEDLMRLFSRSPARASDASTSASRMAGRRSTN